MDINEMAGQILELLLAKSDKKGIEFVDETTEVLTLCISELIKNSYCRSHYDDILKKVILLIKNDINNNENKEIIYSIEIIDIIRQVVKQFLFPDGCLDLDANDQEDFILTLAERIQDRIGDYPDCPKCGKKIFTWDDCCTNCMINDEKKI